MPIGNTDFARDFQIGASVARMAQQRQERMIELRAQAAQQAMQERETAARANMLIQQTQLINETLKQREDAAREETAFKMAVGQTFQQHLKESMDPETGEPDIATAAMRTGSTLAAISPKLADDWMKSTADLVRAGRMGESGKSFEPYVQSLDIPGGGKVNVLRKGPNESVIVPQGMGVEGANTNAQPITDENGNVLGYQVPGTKGPHYMGAQKPGIATTEEIKAIYDSIKTLQNKYDNMKDTSFSASHPIAGVPNEEKRLLGLKIEEMKLKARRLEKGPQASKAPVSTKLKKESDNLLPGTIIEQDGVQYQRQADGTYTEVR